MQAYIINACIIMDAFVIASVSIVVYLSDRGCGGSKSNAAGVSDATAVQPAAGSSSTTTTSTATSTTTKQQPEKPAAAATTTTTNSGTAAPPPVISDQQFKSSSDGEEKTATPAASTSSAAAADAAPAASSSDATAAPAPALTTRRSQREAEQDVVPIDPSLAGTAADPTLSPEQQAALAAAESAPRDVSFLTQLPVAQYYHPALLYSARFDKSGLQAAYPPRWQKQINKNWVWMQIQEQEKTKAPCDPTKKLRFARYNSAKLIADLDVSKVFDQFTALDVKPAVYDYEASPDPSEIHFHVNFGDKNMFIFYRSELMAQDEWMTTEHPALPSIREFLLIHGKQEAEAKPLTVDDAGVPTPCLIMNAPHQAVIDALKYNLYGNLFVDAEPDVIAKATTLLPQVTYSNVIVMEALKHGEGRYTEEEITATLRTAITAFSGAAAEAAQEAKDAAAAAGTTATATPPNIVVHTGNWGCGAFGGNIELMCLLQILACRLSGVDRIVYHVLNAEHKTKCENAVKKLEEAVTKLQKKVKAGDEECTLSALASEIEEFGYQWGISNGT